MLESAITCGDGIRGNPGAGVAQSRGSGLGLLWTPKQSCCAGKGVAAQRGAAWPRRRGVLFQAEARQGDALGFGRLRQRGRVRRGVTVWFKGNKAGIAAWSSGIRIPASSPVISGAALKASRPLIRVLVINDNGLWINDFI